MVDSDHKLKYSLPKVLMFSKIMKMQKEIVEGLLDDFIFGQLLVST